MYGFIYVNMYRGKEKMLGCGVRGIGFLLLIKISLVIRFVFCLVNIVVKVYLNKNICIFLSFKKK